MICRDCLAALIISFNFSTTYNASIAQHRRKAIGRRPTSIVLDSDEDGREAADNAGTSTKQRRDHDENTLLDINTNRKYRCSMCDRRFGDERNLSKHMERHTTCRVHVPCAKCGLKFLIPAHLKDHLC